MQLTMEYEQKKAEEEMAAKMFEMKKAQYDLQRRQEIEMAALMEKQAPKPPEPVIQEPVQTSVPLAPTTPVAMAAVPSYAPSYAPSYVSTATPVRATAVAASPARATYMTYGTPQMGTPIGTPMRGASVVIR